MLSLHALHEAELDAERGGQTAVINLHHCAVALNQLADRLPLHNTQLLKTLDALKGIFPLTMSSAHLHNGCVAVRTSASRKCQLGAHTVKHTASTWAGQ